jgi:hypothetical protein
MIALGRTLSIPKEGMITCTAIGTPRQGVGLPHDFFHSLESVRNKSVMEAIWPGAYIGALSFNDM